MKHIFSFFVLSFIFNFILNISGNPYVLANIDVSEINETAASKEEARRPTTRRPHKPDDEGNKGLINFGHIYTNANTNERQRQVSLQTLNETRRPYNKNELSQLRRILPIGQLRTTPVQGKINSISPRCKLNTWTISMKDPLDGSNWDIEASLFLPSNASASQKVPAMLMMPPITGTFFLDHQIAINLCNQNIAIFSFDPIRPENRESDDLSFDRYDQTLVRMLTPAHWAFEIISNLSVIDSSRIGAMGMSLGGILASLFSAYETRINTLVYVVAGGYLPGILTYTQQKLLAKIREETMTKHSWTDVNDYEAALIGAIHQDPYLWSEGLKNKKIMAIISNADTFVPTRYQYSFAARLNPQVVTVVDTNHNMTLLLAPYTFSNAFANFINSP